MEAAEADQGEATAVLQAAMVVDTSLHLDHPLWQHHRCLKVDTLSRANYFLIVLFVCLFLSGN